MRNRFKYLSQISLSLCKIIHLDLQERCAEHNLQATDWLVEKIQQVAAMLTVRHGVMVIGEPMSAKTRVGQKICKS